MVQDHDEADDITQEVFIKVYSALKDFREESNLFTWLYRIATNYSINHIKKTKTRNTVSVEMILEPIESGDKAADELMDEQNRRQILEAAINTLPEQQRAAFNLRYYEQLPYDEIAEILGKSVGGIKANYFHAMKKIGEYVKGKIEL
jgi:RNA polymerase sigma-70 factor (ECF subfamily)